MQQLNKWVALILFAIIFCGCVPASASPTILPTVTKPFSFTSSPIVAGTKTAENQILTPLPLTFTLILNIYPLLPGTTWRYTDIEYVPDPRDATKTVQAEYELIQTVNEIRMMNNTYFARIQQKVKKLHEDLGWPEADHNAPIDYTIWYIVNDGKVYSSVELPAELSSIDYKRLIEEFSFPLQKGQKWCPDKIGKGSVDDPATVTPCNPIGEREVLSEEPYPSAPGPYQKCYQIEDVFNSGGIAQTFCEGVGIVRLEYGHRGSQFGFSQTLTDFIPGKKSPSVPTENEKPSPKY